MNNTTEFQPFPKMARLNREIVITEKLDGTNAQIFIVPTAELSPGEFLSHATYIEDFSIEGSVVIFVGSRTRWIQPGNDNYGFAKWVFDNAVELKKLGPGRHFGEWWGGGFRRGYGLKEKRFSLFNVHRWGYVDGSTHGPVVDLQTTLVGPACCHVVPTLYRGDFDSNSIDACLGRLAESGSIAAPGFAHPEGIVVYHTAANSCFKVTLENDESPKSTLDKIATPE